MTKPPIVETEGQTISDTIDLQALIARASRASGLTESNIRSVVHEIDREASKAGRIVFDAVTSDKGAETLWEGLAKAFFGPVDDEAPK